ncbi:E3 ubiquitin-protein ligase TRAIP [Triplophysa rosa]|uniref:E3 ubiquitin-protein ligase TRAIP n=1 Tax=Triplophysa rosa TaxID=992332 RepID=A0A9W7WDL0_TRIRA|nr:E3 ubiquitin-protein ligase TRAIP [Triplophysa rosa]XP_057218461.1 E3 ubiquitin-protein ligase TRAIP [Triplophysa rosa]XP_057218462.1 E3 ubiquitin-protein ligase TRAIP [Triplophysa rosa]KAI7795300.1 E3 ubiquitin-protein ligase TRAIP [Triplophysa rosa]
MPIRAYCTICSDFFDNSKDVAAIHCGHTFHYACLLQWFQSAPSKTCPQCRKQVSTRHIINKLFFDIAPEDDAISVDPESLQNDMARMKAMLCEKEKEWRDKQKSVDTLKETIERQKKDLDKLRKDIGDKEMLCSVLRKQMNFLESQKNEGQAAKEEAKRLRVKMKTYESLDAVLQGQRSEVEAMITDMGVGQSAVEQLSIYCISLKKEYDNLKGSLKSSNEMCEKLKRELISTNSKLQKATSETSRANDDMRALQKDLSNADKEITSLKKKVEILQRTLSTPTRTNEAISRLVFESPAPLELKRPGHGQLSDSQEIDLNLTFDINTPEQVEKKPIQVPSKKMRLDPSASLSTNSENTLGRNNARVKDDDVMGPMIRNSLLFRKNAFGSMLDPSKFGTVRTGYDGLGGRAKFIQSSPLSEIRPLAMKPKRKKVSRPVSSKPTSTLTTLDSFLE